jgi:transcriptional regulator with XRE-family HTH domain
LSAPWSTVSYTATETWGSKLMTMKPDPLSQGQLGQEVVADGRLLELRLDLGLTRNAMAEMLQTAPLTYTTWEKGMVKLRGDTAARVGRFYVSAKRALELLREDDLDPVKLIPFHEVATQLGLPQEVLHRRHRDGEVHGIDAGILGLWLRRTDLDGLRTHR